MDSVTVETKHSEKKLQRCWGKAVSGSNLARGICVI